MGAIGVPILAVNMAETSRSDIERVRGRRLRSVPIAPLGGLGAVALPLLMVFAVIAAIYVARDVLIPFALAALLSFLLALPVRGLRRLGLPQAGAVTLVMLGTLLAAISLGVLISRQAQLLATDLPRYEVNIRDKIRAFKDWESGEGFFTKLRSTFSDLGRELTLTRPKPSIETPPPVLSGEAQREAERQRKNEPPPQPLQTQSEPMSLERLRGMVEPVVGPLAEFGLVMLFTVFILLQREDLRNRVIRLAGAGDINRATVAMTDAASRLSRFFLLQASLNVSFGVFVALALWALDVPAAVGFGVFSALMRFVPYIGSVLAALPPIAVAAAIDPGWTTALLVAAVFGIGEPLMGHVIEPVVFGRHTGLSPIAVVGAATFWTWLWGPIGLLLSTPLTLCLVVMGQHMRLLQFLTVLLSDEPALTPAEVFYQRLLAGDAAELVWQAETALKTRSLVSHYDEVVLPGLRLAVLDGRAGHLDEDRLQDVAVALDDLVETLGDADLGADKSDARDLDEQDAGEALTVGQGWRELLARIPPGGLAPGWRAVGAVVIYPGRGILDFASARMAADLLEKIGFGAEVRPRERAAGRTDAPALPRVEIVTTVGGLTARELRFAVRRLERTRAGRDVIACALGGGGNGIDEELPVVRSFAELLSRVIERASSTTPDEPALRSPAALEVVQRV